MIKFNTLFTNIVSFDHFYLKRFANNQNSVSHFLLSGCFIPKRNKTCLFLQGIPKFIFFIKNKKQIPQKSNFSHKGIKYAEN